MGQLKEDTLPGSGPTGTAETTQPPITEGNITDSDAAPMPAATEDQLNGI